MLCHLGNTSGKTVLDLGAGKAETLIELKRKHPFTRAIALELIEPNNLAEIRKCGVEYRISNLEADNLEELQGQCDFVLCGDVLEHTIDPWQVLRKIRRLLKPNGTLVVSIPNVAYWKVLCAVILKNDFKYTTSGILDRSHLRFFTKISFMRTLQECGFSVSSIYSKTAKENRVKTVINKATHGILEPFMTIQYIVVSTPDGTDGAN